MFNVHASGGEEMMRAARDAAESKSSQLKIKRPILIAVTVLTSFSQEQFQQTLNLQRSIADQVPHLALLAQNAGLDGVVASPHEIKLIRQTCGNRFVIVTPGIRPAHAATEDQKRIMTPAEAIRLGSDYLVVGRPVIAAPSPKEAAQKILEEISL
jgi:orotidine-5'-phosphate decarboxylase